MKMLGVCVLAWAGLAGCAFAQTAAEAAPSAALVRHWVVPAGETVQPPRDAPAFFRKSGRFAVPGQGRVEDVGAHAVGGVPALPVNGQPVQGISAILPTVDGFWGLSDNGFGQRRNSADAMLMIHRFGLTDVGVERVETVFLSDPDRLAPFAIVSEMDRRRYLTGADFDPESFAPRAGGGFWVGDEFGPYLLEFDARGRLLALFDLPGEGMRAPESWRGGVLGQVGRSRGLEGMAHSADGRFLYPMLEAPLLIDGQPERVDGAPVARVLEFDTAVREFTEREWFYPLEADDHAIGDITMIGEGRALVIERDGHHGVVAEFKRIFEVELSPAGGVLEKRLVLDLLAIADPNVLSGSRAEGGVYAMSFVTIESVAQLPNGDVLALNDNNYPAGGARGNAAPDDTEVARIRLSTPPPR